MARRFRRGKRGAKPVAAPDAELMGRFADIVGRAREQAAQASPASDPVALFLGLRRFYKETGTRGIMIVALELGDMAICACPPGDPRRLDVLAESCALFRMAYEEAASPPPEARELLRKFPTLPELLLRRAIEDGRDAVAAAPADHPAYLAARTHLGNALLTQFLRSGDASALDEAAARHGEVLERLPPDHPELVTVHTNLGNVLRQRAARDDDGPALDQAISHYRRALAEAAKRDEPAVAIQVGLGEALIMLAARDGNMAAVGEAGQLLRSAAKALPAQHPVLAQLRGQLDLLDLADAAAAEAARAQTAATPAADPADPAETGLPSIADFEHMIGIYEASGHLPHLAGAVDGLRALLAGTAPGQAEPLGSFGHYHASHALGTALWSLFERTGDLAALDESAARLQEAAEAPSVNGDLRLKSKANLAGVLILRGRHTGRRDDLERAIALARSVVGQTPAGDPALGGRMATVAYGLRWLVQQTGDSSLASETVEVHRAAIGAQQANGAADEPGTFPPALSNLGLSLLDLWQLTGRRAALDEAVDLCRQATGLTPPGHPLAPRMQGNLATALNQRYLAAGDGDDREAATVAAKRAFAATAEDHPNRAERGFLLASLLLDGYASGGDLRTLDEVVATAMMATRAAPPGHQLWAQNAMLLAAARTLRGADHAGSPADLRAAAALLAEVTAAPGIPASLRVQACRQQSITQLVLGDPGAALRAARAAVERLPRVAPRNLARADRERPLIGLRGLGSDACALAIASGDPELALSLLEQGRGILLQQAADDRADLTELREREPVLAAEFERVRDLLDPANLTELPGESPGVTSAGLATQRREALAAEWDDLLTRIRNRPGFARFLRLPTVNDLAARCLGGHAVAVNVSALRCDALILSPHGVRVLPLPGLTFGEAESRAATFAADIATSWWQPGPEACRVRETLRWLWEAVCAPVLDAIGATGTPANGEPWPRVWWVPTGPLAFLPLHAACRDPGGDPAGTDTVLDRVVSCYLPTIRSLPAAAAGAVPTAGAGPAAALVIAMRETPGHAGLNVTEEARHVADCLPGTKVLTGAEATHDSVRAALSRFPWVHFACHAVAAARDGAGARLLLHDHAERPLTVREIASLRPHRAELAYLSACESAYGPAGLADEAVHLAGTFHLAGYQHVIGTLWPAADHVAAEIAMAVYERITTPVPDVAKTALALHDAVRRARDRNRDLPVLWAAHIHVGR